MTEQYTQKVKVTPSAQNRKKLIIGVVLCMFSVIFVFLSAFFNKYCIIGFLLLLFGGVVFLQLYGNCACGYEYNFNDAKLIIVARNMFGHQKRIITIDTADIVGFFELSQQDTQVSQEDVQPYIALCDIDNCDNVYSLVYKHGNDEKCLLLASDRFLSAIISTTIHNKIIQKIFDKELTTMPEMK